MAFSGCRLKIRQTIQKIFIRGGITPCRPSKILIYPSNPSTRRWAKSTAFSTRCFCWPNCLPAVLTLIGRRCKKFLSAFSRESTKLRPASRTLCRQNGIVRMIPNAAGSFLQQRFIPRTKRRERPNGVPPFYFAAFLID